MLGALIAGPTVYVFSGGVVAAAAAAIGGALLLSLARRAAGARLPLLAILTLLAVIVGGPVLMAVGSALSPAGTGNAGFLGLLFVFGLAGQLVALPLGIVASLVHVVVARVTK